MAVTAQSLIDTFPELFQLVTGDPTTPITHPLPMSVVPESGCLIFVNDEKFLPKKTSDHGFTLVVPINLATRAQDCEAACLLQSPNTGLSMAWSFQEFFPVTKNKQAFDGERLHPSAVISKSAKIGEGALVGPNAVIGPEVQIGKNCVIGANSTLEAEVQIGEETHIHPQVFLGHSCILGDRCEVHPQASIGTEGYGYAHDSQGGHHRIPHYGKVRIGEHVHIGAGCLIDRGTFGDTVIGDGTKLDNQCHIAHNVRIGKNCLITAGLIVGGSATIGDNNVFGGRATVSGHIKIGDQMQFAALSGVQTSVNEPGSKFGGFPLQPLRQSLRSLTTLEHLPEMRKQLRQLLKKNSGNDEESN